VDALADESRWERLEREATEGAESLFEELVALIRTEMPRMVSRAWAGALEQIFDQLGVEGMLSLDRSRWRRRVS
jgi:hypothetical protein